MGWLWFGHSEWHALCWRLQLNLNYAFHFSKVLEPQRLKPISSSSFTAGMNALLHAV
jgi:hypothetical protein